MHCKIIRGHRARLYKTSRRNIRHHHFVLAGQAYNMRIALVLFAAAAAVAQEHSTHPPDPNRKCHCFIGDHNTFLHAKLFEWWPFYDSECDKSSDQLCVEECLEHKDVLEAEGAWDYHFPNHHHPGNLSIGDVACENLGRDESRGIIGNLYHYICEDPPHFTGVALREPLCCDMGKHVRCHF